MQRVAPVFVVVVLGAALATRIVDLTSLPALRGFDPYLRLFERETFVIDFFGRRWLPGFQSLIVSAYWLDWGLPAVRLASAALSAAYVALAFAFGWRRFGLFFGFAFSACLFLDADLVHVSAAPYQEPLFFVLLAAGLLAFSRLESEPRMRDLGPVCIALLGASITRNEAVVLGLALAIAIVFGGASGRPAPRLRVTLGPAALLTAIPLLVNAAVVLSVGGDVGVPYGRFGRIDANFAHVATYLLAPHVTLLWALGIIGLALSFTDGRAWDRDVLALNAFCFGFLLLYLIWSPYMPTDSRRFHLPLTLWASFNAATTLTLGLDALGRHFGAHPATLQRAGAVVAAASLGIFLLVDADRAIGDGGTRIVAHVSARVTGESIDAAVGRDATVVLPGTQSGVWAKTGIRTMRIFGYMAGSPSRLLFAEDLTALDGAGLRATIRERDVRAVLLDVAEDESVVVRFRGALESAGGGDVRERRVGRYRLLVRE